MNVRIFEGDETVCQQILWRGDILGLKTCIGLNATTLNSRRPIMEACMRPRVLTIFQHSLSAQAQAACTAALAAAQVTDTANGNHDAANQVCTNGVDHYHVNDHLD